MSADIKIKELFWAGGLNDGYKYFGCKYERGSDKARFTVWAPRAKNVFLVGDFNNWDESAHPMRNDDGIWSAEANNVKEFDGYKYIIETQDGRKLYKSDPYAFHAETSGDTNSKVYDITRYKWTDKLWEEKKNKTTFYDKPVNIYEAHIGSWRRYPDGSPFSYRKFADEIAVYLKEMNYTHLELIGLAEHPFDGSWGYQVTGYYAPTSRFGTPEDFMYLVDTLHNNGIGIIVDWVPGHFPKDAHGLYEFDGFPLYEPSDPLKMEHEEWGTRCFDYSNGAIKSFLISNALYWLKAYHVDGLRVDAVASMLYLDYGRKAYRPNVYGGKENLDAIDFFKKLNTGVFASCPGVMMIAEESTAWPLVTKPVDAGGLGFNFKWNMGWMNDTLSYIKTDPLFRAGKHNNLTFSMTYAFSENYILSVSHDEVVHGKGTLLNKMPGSYEEKFAGWRNYLMSMFTHPGKKLTFMGTEFGQFSEWNEAKELDWMLLGYPAHSHALEFMKTLGEIYLKNPALWEIEDGWDGFQWLVPDDRLQNVIAYERSDKKGTRLLAVYNFSPVKYASYRFGCRPGTFTTVLQSDVKGWNTDKRIYRTQKAESHGYKDSIVMDIQPISGVYMICQTKNKTAIKKQP